MEEIKDFNLEEVRKYLKENELDETLADSPFFVENFSSKETGEYLGSIVRLIVYFDKENNLITTYFRDILRKCRIKGPETRVKVEGKTILIEKLSRRQETVHYSIDDPLGEDKEKYIIRKVTYYIDEKGETLLAKETREKYNVR